VNETKILSKIRSWSLWAALGSAVVLLVINILKIWEVLDYKGDSVMGKIESTIAIIMMMSILLLLVMLIWSRIRKIKE